MAKKTPVLCRVWGHKFDPIEIDFYGVHFCIRCGEHEPEQIGIHDRLLAFKWWCYFTIKDNLEYVKDWWRCKECGKYFGRHNENIEHLPF